MHAVYEPKAYRQLFEETDPLFQRPNVVENLRHVTVVLAYAP
jgi:hypothetical protein